MHTAQLHIPISFGCKDTIRMEGGRKKWQNEKSTARGNYAHQFSKHINAIIVALILMQLLLMRI